MKKITILIILLCSVFISFGQGGIPILAPIITNGPATYPTHLDSLGMGGYMALLDTFSRNNIPVQRRKEGMMVRTITDKKNWVLSDGINNNNWQEYLVPLNTKGEFTIVSNSSTNILVSSLLQGVTVSRISYSTQTYNSQFFTKPFVSNTLTLTTPNAKFYVGQLITITPDTVSGSFNSNNSVGGITVTMPNAWGISGNNTAQISIIGLGSAQNDYMNGSGTLSSNSNFPVSIPVSNAISTAFDNLNDSYLITQARIAHFDSVVADARKPLSDSTARPFNAYFNNTTGVYTVPISFVDSIILGHIIDTQYIATDTLHIFSTDTTHLYINDSLHIGSYLPLILDSTLTKISGKGNQLKFDSLGQFTLNSDAIFSTSSYMSNTGGTIQTTTTGTQILDGSGSSSLVIQNFNNVSLSSSSIFSLTGGAGSSLNASTLSLNTSNLLNLTAPKINASNIPAYINDAAAGTAGLTTGTIWQTSSSNTLSLPAGVLMIKQ